MPSISATNFGQEGETLNQVLDGLKLDTATPIEPEAEEKENSSDSSTEKNQEAETQSSEGDKKEDKTSEDTQDVKDEPFHKRWKEQRDKLERDFQVKLEEQSKQFEEKLQAIKPVDSIQTPEWVKKIYGESAEGVEFYKNFKAEREQELSQFEANILAKQRLEVERSRQEEQRWTGWVKEQLDSLKDDGKTFDQNELMKVATDYMPTDEEGNISFPKAYAIYERLKASEAQPEKQDARKRLADAATASKSNSTEASPKSYQTPDTLRNKSWNDF